MNTQIEDMQERWQDEAAEAAVNGNPRRSDYIYYMAAHAPRLVHEAQLRAVADGRSWPAPTLEQQQHARAGLGRAS